MSLFDTFANDFPVEKVVYVNADPEICDERIHRRCRNGESNIPLSYLKSCHDYHNVMINEKLQLKSNKWKQWLSHPESLIIPTDNIPNKILLKLNSRTSSIEKDISKFTEEFEKVKTQQIINGNLTVTANVTSTSMRAQAMTMGIIFGG